MTDALVEVIMLMLRYNKLYWRARKHSVDASSLIICRQTVAESRVSYAQRPPRTQSAIVGLKVHRSSDVRLAQDCVEGQSRCFERTLLQNLR